jgi:putative flippase GtrA
MSRLKPLFSLLAATLIVMAVAFVDGRPTVFYDSHSYDVMGRNLIQVVQEFPQSVRFKMKPGVTWGDEPVTTDRQIDAAVEGARSAYYGVLLHGTFLIGSLWLLAALQSFLAVWVVYLLWRTLAPKAPLWSFLVLVAGVVIGSSLPFFTAFAMPDVFAGIGGGVMVLLLSQTDRLRRWELVGLWLLLVYSLAIHKSHLATAAGMTVVGLALIWLMGARQKLVLQRGALMVGAIAVAWMSGVAFGAVYKARTGLDLAHPPFMMARVMADGPGRDYLRTACAQNPDAYAACRFSGNVTKYSTENLLLWSDRPKRGVFNIADRPTRVRLEKEEMRFVLGTVLHDPLGQALASLKNWGEQFVSFQVDDPLRNPAAYLRGRYWPTTTLPKLIPNFDACRPPHDCSPPFNREGLAWWHGSVLVVSLLFLIWGLSRPDVLQSARRRGLKTGEEPARVLTVVLLVLGVVIVNAAVCGILSGPFARYQSRLAWLLPVAAGLTLCAMPVSLAKAAQAWRALFGLAMVVWDWFRRFPVVGRFLPPLDGHFFRFCVVGALGFVVDATVLKLGIHFGLGSIAARAVSFPVAVAATWLTNRTWTFQGKAPQSRLKEASTYVLVQLVGGAANFAVYIGLVTGVAALQGRVIVALAAGAAAGLSINYLGSKHIVFRGKAPAAL